MSLPDYPTLVAELFPRLTGGIRWGLDRTQRLLAGVGDPHRAYRVLHVGGTNGKGSVAAHLERMLRVAGHRVGLYTSPHLCTFRERIRIAGDAIDEAALLAAAHRLWPGITSEAPSFFEATTAIAFLAFADAAVDVAVVEVGLGGRLDATNVVHPEVVVLTNVSLDHVQLLGPTLEHVAREKAGIIKPGVPVVTAEAEGAAAAIFRAAAAAAGAPLHTVPPQSLRDITTTTAGTSFVMPDGGGGELVMATPLRGRHQAVNAALAVRAVQLLQEPLRIDVGHMAGALSGLRWPGRLQLEHVAGVPWVFDVAHNVAGVQALRAAVAELTVPRPITVVAGVLGDKDWQHMMPPLAEIGSLVLTSPPTAPEDRRWDPAAVLAAVPLPDAVIVADFTAALERAHARAAAADGTVLVTGSFHTVGDALAALRLCPDGSDFTVAAPSLIRAPGTATDG